MPSIKIQLSPGLFAELKSAAVASSDGAIGYRPEMWAQEAVESMLASRRLQRMPFTPNGYGARPGGLEREPEPVTFHVANPDYSR